jgi:GABA(A) receptor-associated protein
MSFKKHHTFAQRSDEADRVKIKYPNRIPIICEGNLKSFNPIILKKTKYLVPDSLTVGQFAYVLRKQITLKSEEAMFLMINNKLAPTAALLSQVYMDNKDFDGFLYVSIARENTFG